MKTSFVRTLPRRLTGYLSTSISSVEEKEIVFTYRSRFQIEFLYRDAKGFTGLTHCQARDEKKLDFHFNTSLTAVNIAHAFCSDYEKQTGKKISVASAKVLLHNAALVERIFSECGLRPNLKINNTIVKELIMYGVRDTAHITIKKLTNYCYSKNIFFYKYQSIQSLIL